MMTRTTTRRFWTILIFACFVLPCLALAANPEQTKEILDQEFEDSLSEILTPEQSKKFQQIIHGTEKAIRKSAPTLISRTIKISLRPGSPIPKINLVPNFIATISVFDSTGQPWPIETTPPAGNMDFFSIHRPEVPPTNTLTVSAKTDYANTNVVAIIKGQSIPINIQLSTVGPDLENTDKWQTDSRVLLQLDQRGPNATLPVLGEPVLNTVSGPVFAFIDGIPPIDAVKLETIPELPGLDVWLYEEDLFIRSINPLQWPRIKDIAPGAGGKLKVYQTQKEPSLLVNYNGQTKVVSLKEPNY